MLPHTIKKLILKKNVSPIRGGICFLLCITSFISASAVDEEEHKNSANPSVECSKALPALAQSPTEKGESTDRDTETALFRKFILTLLKKVDTRDRSRSGISLDREGASRWVEKLTIRSSRKRR
jgi:hypothetical protein